MKLCIYSTNSNRFSIEAMSVRSKPSCSEQILKLTELFPEIEFTFVLQLPGMYLVDLVKNQFQNLPANTKYFFIEENKSSASEITEIIINQKPDLAVAFTYWVAPFDWLSIKDGIIGEKLRKNGIKTICHPSDSSLICFDKTRTASFLMHNGFNCAKSVYVHHELFYAERNRLEINSNVYKEYVFEKIQELKLPVVVKDTMGLSSYGMDVCNTYAEVKHVLTSKKNNGDRLVEEFLSGPSFGAEIYGVDSNYIISPVLVNSVNQFGLTSPKQNVKLGPVSSEKYNLPELNKELKRLASLLKLNGIAQVDLLFSNNKWYIIEINSRISGMSQTIAAGLGKTLHQLVIETATGTLKETSSGFVMNMKFPILTEQETSLLYKLDFVHYVNQIENHNAKQLREVGYAEVIFGNTKTLSELMNQLEIIKQTLPEKMEIIFYENAQKLTKLL